MPKYQSPGQKRKKIVRIIAIGIFLIVTYIASIFAGNIKDVLYSWVDDHREAPGQVIELTTEEDEYRNLKGRKQTETLYLVSYRFAVDEDEFENTVDVSGSLYRSLHEGSGITVWYASNDPYLNDIQQNIESKVSGNDTLGNMLTVAPYTLPFALFLYYLLSFFFVRESKKKLVPGFFADNAWLDVDDRYVVYLDDAELVYFAFDKHVTSEVQTAYQDELSLEEIITISKSKDITRIPFEDVIAVESRHNSDVIQLETMEKTHSVEFLNQAIKAHALEKIEQQIPSILKYRLDQKSRLEAAIPAMIFLITIFLIGYSVDMFIIRLILGFIGIVWVIPTIFSRLIDPTEVKTWKMPEKAVASET